MLAQARKAVSTHRAKVQPTGDYVVGATPFEMMGDDEVLQLLSPASVSRVVFTDDRSICVQSWIADECWTVLAQRVVNTWTLAAAQGCP
jgi:hypothetical protein